MYIEGIEILCMELHTLVGDLEESVQQPSTIAWGLLGVY